MEMVDLANLMVGVATAAGVIYAIVQGTQTQRHEGKKYYVELLTSITSELAEVKKVEVEMEKDVEKLSGENKGACLRYASDYLNILERISFLGNLGYIDENMLKYLRDELSYGLKLHRWKMTLGFMTESIYPNLIKYTDTKKITDSEDQSKLPKWLDSMMQSVNR